MQDNFDIQALAEYLHLTPDRVQRMADRGRLPGRKVGGQWQFPRAEVHHWLEEQIGDSDDEELARVEDVLERAADVTEPPRIVDLLPLEAVDATLPARSANKIIEQMCELATVAGLLWDPEKMADAVRARENLHPTALDNGVALLHPRRPLPNLMSDPFLALGRSLGGIPFGGSGGKLTDIFFLIGSIDDSGHLRVLARLSRLLALPELVEQLREAPDAQAMRQVLLEQEPHV